MGLVDLAVNPQALSRFHSVPEVRSLPSTDITPLRRYYEPVRHPKRPGLSLAGVRLEGMPPTAGASRVAFVLLCRHAVATTPAGPSMGSGCSPGIDDDGLPRASAGSAPALRFSRPIRRSLTLRLACSRDRQDAEANAMILCYGDEEEAATIVLPFHVPDFDSFKKQFE